MEPHPRPARARFTTSDGEPPVEEALPPAQPPRPWPPTAAPAPPSTADGSRWRRVALALSRASVLALAVAGTATLVVLSPIGTRRTARDTAEREVTDMLEGTERVLARTFASQRRPSDLWRLSHGLLVATDQRVLYVGAAPRTVLRPIDPGPRDLYVESWPYEAAFTLSVDDESLLRLRAPSRSVTYRLDASGEGRALQRVADNARRQRRDERERLLQAGTVRPSAERYVTHVVRRGETLSALAQRYGTSVSVLRQLNRLPDEVVRSGQALRVPEPPPMPDSSADDDSRSNTRDGLRETARPVGRPDY